MSQDNFDACLAVVLRHEGGYVDDPRDPGGATHRGITRKTLAEWRGVTPWQTLSKNEVKFLGRDETRAIYRAFYWQRIAGDELPAGLDLAVFDFAVNSGPARAIAAIQALVGVKPDGIAGPRTLAAVGAAAAKGRTSELINVLSARRLGFLRALTGFAVFGTGWTRRVADTRAQALAMRPTGENLSSPDKKDNSMEFLSGYKTYIVAALMIVTAVAQMAGVDLPGFDGQSAMQLMMEGLAILFLRKGLKTDASSS